MPKVGRNDPCPCGSGKKYKNCCQSVASQPAEARSAAFDPAQIHIAKARNYEELHRFDKAIGSYRTALSINPDLASAHFNLGRALLLCGQYGDARESFRRFLSFSPGYAQAHHFLGAAFEALGQFAEAVDSYRRALELEPTFLPSRFSLVRTLNKVVPLWHVSMTNDANRNDAYFAALRSVVTPQAKVFEIGTGSGLLSMMAVQLGAGQVTTCEAEPLVAATAKQIIADNGFEKKIKVIAKRSTEVVLKSDLPQPAEILIQEVFSSELLAEGVLSSVEDAKRRLLAPGCKMIPAAASIMVALFGGEEIGRNLFLEDVRGLDLRRFNTIVPRMQTVLRNDLDVVLLSEEVEAFKFDFERDSAWHAEEKILQLQVKRPGRCQGILQWIRLYFGGDVVFENHPNVKTSATSWPPCAYLNPLPTSVAQNQIATVFASHDKMLPWFSLRSVE